MDTDDKKFKSTNSYTDPPKLVQFVPFTLVPQSVRASFVPLSCAEVPYPEDTSTGVFSYAFTTCAENVGPLGPWQEECSSYYEYQGERQYSISY